VETLTKIMKRKLQVIKKNYKYLFWDSRKCTGRSMVSMWPLYSVDDANDGVL